MAQTRKTVRKASATGPRTSVKRLSPKSEVLRQLFLLSGNNCAYEDCKNVLVNNKGTMVGDICHIEAAEEGGPRFNAGMSNEDRRSLENLVMLCKPHHAVVDGKNESPEWPAARLRKLKMDHESKFREVGKTLSIAFDRQYVDTTVGSEATVPKTFAAFDEFDPTPFGKPEWEKERAGQVRSYVERISVTPRKYREFAASVLKRWIRLGRKGTVVRVDVNDVEETFSLSTEKVKRLVAGLGRYELGFLDEKADFDRVDYYVALTDPSDFATWIDLIEFAEAESFDVGEFLLEGRFDRLD